MWRRFFQRIYECDVCRTTPDDGEPMWHMGNQIWCKDCCKNNKE